MIKSFGANIFSEKEFWKIIEMLDWHFVGEDENVVKRATQHLSKKSENFIKKFHQMLLQKLRNLQVCGEYFELKERSDTFLNTRCSIVAAGKKYYNSVLSNPSKIRENTEFQELTNLCNNALAMKKGSARVHISVFKYYSGSPHINFS